MSEKIRQICPGCSQVFYINFCHAKNNKRKHCSVNCYSKARSLDFPNRFFALIEIPNDPNECWTWTGHRTPQGYGKIRAQGVNVSAHRYSYAFHYGTFNDAQYVCHSCDKPECVNPNHLFLGTPKENTNDMYKKCRNQPHKKKYKRLTYDQVIEIRNLLEKHIKSTIIAKQYNITPITVCRIKHRKTWINI